MTISNIHFEDWEAEQLKDAEFRTAVEDLEPAYQVARLRMKRGLTQAQLAERVGTKQSSIARLESGKVQPRLSFLRKVISALGGRVDLRILYEGEVEAERQISTRIPEIQPIYVIQINEFPASKGSRKRYTSFRDNNRSDAIPEKALK